MGRDGGTGGSEEPFPGSVSIGERNRAMPLDRGNVVARLASGAALGLCTVWLAGTPPAHARDRISDRDIERARDACREVAQNRGWRDVRVDASDRDEERGQVTLTVRGRRDGEDRERDCTYDLRDERASFEDGDDGRRDDRGGDRRDVERAQDACRQVAENRDWRDVRTEVRDRDRDGRVVVEVSGRRRGEDRDRECRYDVRRGDAEFDDQG